MFEHLQKELSHRAFLTKKEEILLRINTLLRKATTITAPHLLGLSGGVDSSLLALLSPSASKVIVGVEGSEDHQYASTLASTMGWKTTTILLSPHQAESIILNVIDILTKHNVPRDPINVGVGAVDYVLCQEAKRQNISLLVSGLGAEEIFGGYRSHVERMASAPETFQNFCWQRLTNIEQRDLARDQAIAQEFNMKLYAPFLEENLVRYAMQIDPSLKVQGNERKVILRELAVHCGVPQNIAWRKKVAAQYGSGFDRVLEAMTKKAGFKGKLAYLQHHRTTRK